VVRYRPLRTPEALENAMTRRFAVGLAASALGAGLACAALAPAERARRAAAAVDDARLAAADAAVGDWLTHGRTYAEERYSPLAEIDEGNVAQLGLAWWLDTDTTRGLEATPLVADGILYTTGSWSVVFAVDARSGELLWTYDPEVPREKGRHACCDVVNRGVALYRGRVYVGTLDGRLVVAALGGRVAIGKLRVGDGAKAAAAAIFAAGGVEAGERLR